MAKVILTIDGKKKTFVKDKLNLGTLKRQAEFEQKMQSMDQNVVKYQKFLKENAKFVEAANKAEQAFEEAETEEDVQQAQALAEEIEQMEGFDAFESESERLQEELAEQGNINIQMYDDFAQLLVNVFDEKFTIDDVFDGLDVERSLPETYHKIFEDNTSGKPKKKAPTTKTKQQKTS